MDPNHTGAYALSYCLCMHQVDRYLGFKATGSKDILHFLPQSYAPIKAMCWLCFLVGWVSIMKRVLCRYY
jgi:hypothetical protein